MYGIQSGGFGTQSQLVSGTQSKCGDNGNQCEDVNDVKDKLRNKDSNSVAVIVRGGTATVSGKRSRRGRCAIRAVRQPLTSATSDFAWEDAMTDEGANASAGLAMHCTAVTRSRSPLKGGGMNAI